jgi:hypothetical protein
MMASGEHGPDEGASRPLCFIAAARDSQTGKFYALETVQ